MPLKGQSRFQLFQISLDSNSYTVCVCVLLELLGLYKLFSCCFNCSNFCFVLFFSGSPSQQHIVGPAEWTTNLLLMIAVSRSRTLYQRLNNDFKGRLAGCTLHTSSSTISRLRWGNTGKLQRTTWPDYKHICIHIYPCICRLVGTEGHVMFDMLSLEFREIIFYSKLLLLLQQAEDSKLTKDIYCQFPHTDRWNTLLSSYCYKASNKNKTR